MESAEPGTSSAFADLGISEGPLGALAELGYEEPTPIQRESIPPLIAGRDLVGQAATGTGKTAAFALPAIERVLSSDRSAPTVLIVTPTRELAMQVSQAVHRYGRSSGVRVVPVYGGQHIGRQLDALRRGVDVVVATPGRAIDHLNRHSLRLESLSMVVLDEADEMLDMGFAEDIEAILSATPPERQTVLFSATMPRRIDSIVRRHLSDPIRITIETAAGDSETTPTVRQSAYVVARQNKAAALGRILDVEQPTATLVFCRTRHEVDSLTETLNGRGYRAEGLHGGMSQEQRDRVMSRLRNRTAELLIATDVAARGLDVEHLTHVVNYDVPSAPESYVHRIGRVGRAGRTGVAVTLAEPREQRLLKNIERATGTPVKVERVPSAEELRTKRLQMTLAAMQDSLRSDDLDRFRAVVDPLSEESDLFEIALAAVRLAHEATVGTDDIEDIPDADTRRSKNDRGPKRRGRDAIGPKDRSDRRASQGMTRLFVGAGREAGIRPKDLVGAIANETKLNGKQIGAIEIQERFSLVEVPSGSVDEVLWTMRKTTLKGRKVKVRKDKF